MAAPPTDEILAWAKKQPAWRQDALRRILTKPFSKADEDECLALLKAEKGFAKPKHGPEPLDPKHLPLRSGTATKLRLLKLDGVANVNRLSDDAALEFAADGITLIYGDNGSGKSGFIRILKRACRARDTEKILPNVFGKAATAPASAQFTVDEGSGAEQPIQWQDDKPSSDQLGRFAIFDSKCASVHVDGENRIEVIPHNLDCFERLAQLCDALSVRLKAECAGLEAQLVGALPVAPEGSTAHEFILQLKTKDEAALDAACLWNEASEKRLAELVEILKDPAAEAARCERLASELGDFAKKLAAIVLALNDAKMVELANLRLAARDARAKANDSAAAAFSKEPLRGAGEDVWRVMFDAARAYSQAFAYPKEIFPVVGPDASCVLCQQTLDEASKDRFKRFEEFVTGAMNAKAKTAEEARDAFVKLLSAADFSAPGLSKELKAHLANKIPKEAAECEAVCTAVNERRDGAIADKHLSQALPAIPDAPLQTEIAALLAAAKDARALTGANPEEAQKLRRVHGELVGAKLLHESKAELKRRLDVFAQIAKLDECIKSCATKQISDHGAKLLKAHVTEALGTSMEDEKKSFGIQDIPLLLTGRTTKASVQHRLKLDGATLSADTSAILSEGEHRAVALAAFLAELKMFPSLDAIIIDDPVSSLDHKRRSNVADRLVAEAKDRQVIVLTHDLVFVSEVGFYAAKRNIPLKVIGIHRGANGYGSLDPDGEPWLTKNIKGRKHWLTVQLANLNKLRKAGSGDYELQLDFFYGRLRESWEKLVEERVFGQVIGRFQPQIQTERLRNAFIDDEIFAQIHFGMSAVSSYTGHDRAAAKGGALAEPAECEKDLKEFVACLDELEKRAEAAGKDRSVRIKRGKL